MAAESQRTKKLLYQLTALDNVEDIVRNGILSRRALNAAKKAFADHASPEILAGRAKHGLDALVPFHFITRNPFDYAAVKRSPTTPFVLFAVHRQFAAANNWRVCPRHPLTDAEAPQLLDWQSGLNAIDWNQMDKRPRDYSTDRDCRLACMAEALSPMPVLPSHWHSIYAATDDTKLAVSKILLAAKLGTLVNLNPRMFPEGAR